jgi:translation initiation factor 2 subunit 2
MAKDFDYEGLLNRAKDRLPKKTITHERFTVPSADVFIEGKSTIIRNFGEIIDTLGRDENHLLQFLQQELGSAGSIRGKRAIFKRKLAPTDIDAKIKRYTETYVTCKECSKPDTRLVKEGRVMVMECDACGAKKAIKARRIERVVQVFELRSGDTHELLIQDVGAKGDGIAKIDKYIIYVPGASKGQKVKIKIDNVSGTRAFGRVVRE